MTQSDEQPQQGRPKLKRVEYAITTQSVVFSQSGGKNFEPVYPPRNGSDESQIEWEQVDMAAAQGSVTMLWRRLVPIK